MNKMDILLYMVAANNGKEIRGKTRLMKMMYILEAKFNKLHKHRHIAFYRFRKHYYGPYSDEINIDISTLVENKLVDHKIAMYQTYMGIREENVYRITEKSLKEINDKPERFDSETISIIEHVKANYNDIPLSLLIHEVYTKYPMRTQ